MCGFVTWVSLRPDRSPDPRLLESMLDTLRHRGPDEGRIVVRGPVGMGHRRLRVIDLETGAQPMSSADGEIRLVFNGEIYNYLELRRSLQSDGIVFRTASDTEVLLEAYRRYGTACLDKLRGMFAFAIWDEGKRRLFAARDRIGKKPLYYRFVENDRIVLASEPKAILADPSFPRRADAAAFSLYLRLLYVPEGCCAFQGMGKLPPGHFLLLEDGNLSVAKYWQVSRNNRAPGSREEALHGIRMRLDEAVRLRLRSDVPLGVFLSGGIDSTAVALSAARQMDRPIRTISVGFPGLGDERLQARDVAHVCGSSHVELDVRPDRIEDLVIRMTLIFDEPFADTSCIPTWLLAGKARETVTVVLSGDGGDELFAGYLHYLDHLRADEVARSGATAGQRAAHAIAPILRRVAMRFPSLLRAAGKSADRVRDGYRAVEASGQASALRRHLALVTKDAAIGTLSEEMRSLAAKAFDEFASARADLGDPLRTIFDFDLTQYLPGDILKKVDMATMAHGLECRSPLLDQELLEYAMSIPPEWKLAGGKTKSLLKEIVAQEMGEDFVRRPKQGFGIPIHDWLRTPALKGLIDETFRGGGGVSSGFWSPEAVRTLCARYYRGERDLAYPVWAILCGELWAREYRVVC